jgi:plastocyanin
MTAGRGRAALALAGLLAAGALAGCSGGSGGAAATASDTPGPGVGVVTTAPDGAQEITLQTQDDYVFTPSTFTVAPGHVRLTVTNRATQLTHNFRFTPGKGPVDIPQQIPILAPGQSRTIEFDVPAPGDYGFECSFHTALGQVGTMTVAQP